MSCADVRDVTATLVDLDFLVGTADADSHMTVLDAVVHVVHMVGNKKRPYHVEDQEGWAC